MPVNAADVPGSLAPFQNNLVGTWLNKALPGAPNGEGGPDNPLSYNVMPLPQATPLQGQDTGYILKNSTVYEVLEFAGEPAPGTAYPPSPPYPQPTTAANRAANALQLPTALYYTQVVFFGGNPGGATQPDRGKVVHSENGSWLHLLTGPKFVTPYQNATLDNPNQQPPDRTVAKQMSVPHGNQILALGKYDEPTGSPTIPDAAEILPTPSGLDVSPYDTVLTADGAFQNPRPDYTKNVNLPLQQGVEMLAVTNSLHWQVTTKPLADGSSGSTMNIPFERSAADVVDYTALYWLMSTTGDDNYQYLAYSQNIGLKIAIGGTTYRFVHWTSNLLTKQ